MFKRNVADSIDILNMKTEDDEEDIWPITAKAEAVIISETFYQTIQPLSGTPHRPFSPKSQNRNKKIEDI